MPRGRPRKYDPERALDAALGVFWDRGYQGTTLDDLCKAMGMHRPSVYAAFGGKRALFTQVLARFQERLSAHGRRALSDPDLESALWDLFVGTAELYRSPESGRGCLVFSVAAVDAVEDEAMRAHVEGAVQELDGALRARFGQAVDEGALPAQTDVDGRARIAASIVHGLSVRSRTQADPADLQRLSAAAAALLAQP